MPYPVAKLLKEKIGENYKLTSDGSQMLNEILDKLESKMSRSGKTNYLDSANNLLGEDLGPKLDSDAKSNAANTSNYKTTSEASKGLDLVFSVNRPRGGDLSKAIYMCTFLQTVAYRFLNEAKGYVVNNKVGKAQLILGMSFDKASSIESTVAGMSDVAKLAYKLGYVAVRPTGKQLINPKYTDYGMQSILASKGFQAVKTKVDKDGNRDGDEGLDYKQCMTVLLFRKSGTGCPKPYQTRNILTGRCEGKKPCKSYQTRNESSGRCVGTNPEKKKKSDCKYGVKKSGACKKKPGPKKSRRAR